MIWIIQNTRESFFRRLQRYSTSSIVYLCIQRKVNDIFALLVKRDLTIADLDATWVKNTLDNLCHNHIRRWLEIPPCGTIDILLLSTKQYGINLLDISTKFEQCQATIRKNLKESPNDIRELFQIISFGSDIKYNSFQSNREVLAQTRQSK